MNSESYSIPQNAAGRKALINAIEKDSAMLEDCFDDFFSPNLRKCQEISWILVQIGGARPDLIVPYFEKMFSALKDPKAHNALVRNTIRIWQEMHIDEDYRGIIFDICYKYFLDAKRQIAVRAFSINVCVNLCRIHPELKDDLIHALELVMSVKNDNFYLPYRCKAAIAEIGKIG